MILDVALWPVVKKAIQYTGDNVDELVSFSKCSVLKKDVHDGSLSVIFKDEVDHIRVTDWVILNQVNGFYVKQDFEFRNTYYICNEKNDNEIWYDEKFDR